MSDHENYHPERLDDDHLFGRFEAETHLAELWRRRAENSLAELTLRGLIAKEEN